MFGSGCARSLDKVVPHAIIDLQLHGSPGGVGPGDELKVVTQEHLVATNHLRKVGSAQVVRAQKQSHKDDKQAMGAIKAIRMSTRAAR